jgi:hypothetical protein
MFAKKMLRRLAASITSMIGGRGRSWKQRTLVVGPTEPVDGDSVACTKALIAHLRKQGKEAFTLPTIAMYPQIEWILDMSDFHPAVLMYASEHYTTGELQAAYDNLLRSWRPDEIVLVDGPPNRLGFDPRGVPVFTIDHHTDKAHARDDEEAYIQPAPANGCLLIQHFGVYEPILVVSILTDTFWLRQNMPAEAIDSLKELRDHGLTDELLIEIQRRLMVPKNPEIILALQRSYLRVQGDAVFALLREADPDIHRGVMGELGYFFRNICVVRGDGYISFRTTDRQVHLRPLAIKWFGGGHDNVAAGRLTPMSDEALNALHADFMAAVNSMS